ncbi:TPA: hypothetical protein ACXDAY_002846 [Clostridium botulinum]|uniref:hypothetical protein n=1 Tax=Clostridium botulinum TaxID=1491 RepID=UPI00035BB06A|nr:hypothetical protein [Clostridium botulinum]EPS56394.1 hypothetical protein CLQ_12893 [Clostridium botulinum Af84]
MSEEMKRIWKILNERYGIYTMGQLKKEMAKTVLDIGIFTMPFKDSPQEINKVE